MEKSAVFLSPQTTVNQHLTTVNLLPRNVHKILIVDLEATCWETSPPKGEVSDIIEVGIALLDTVSLRISGKRAIFVKPSRSTISPFCTELTTITPQLVANAHRLKDVCALLRKEYQSHKHIWASYGDYDRKMLQRSCDDLGIDYPMSRTHINIKSLFAVLLGEKRECGLQAALAKFGLSFEGIHHRGADDAYNIARVLQQLMLRTRGTTDIGQD